VAIDGDGHSTPRPGPFAPVKAPVTIIKDLGGSLTWSGNDMGKRKFLFPTEDRTPTRPAPIQNYYYYYY